MIDLVNKSFQQKTAYTPEQMTKEWGIENPFDVTSDVSHIMDVKNSNINFELYKRAFHVMTEAKRVHDFKAVCEDENLEEEDKVQKLGDLMNAS